MAIIRYREDLLLYSKWVREIIAIHFSEHGSLYVIYTDELQRKPIRVDTHVRMINNIEVDVVITNGKKSIGVELKENDYDKAIKQAIIRRRYFDYMYVVLDMSVHSILEILRRKRYSEVFDYGIGFVSSSDDCVVIRSYSRRRSESKRYSTLLDKLYGAK